MRYDAAEAAAKIIREVTARECWAEVGGGGDAHITWVPDYCEYCYVVFGQVNENWGGQQSHDGALINSWETNLSSQCEDPELVARAILRSLMSPWPQGSHEGRGKGGS